MVISHRAHHILKKILQAQTYVSVNKIKEELLISTRTLYYDVDKINDWLRHNGFSELSYIRKLGYTIPEQEKSPVLEALSNLAESSDYVYSPEERVALIYVLILTRETTITLQDLLSKFQVSRSTLLADIKLLKSELCHNDLELKFNHHAGYYIQGFEQNKRTVLLNYLSKISNTGLWMEDVISTILPSAKNKSINPINPTYLTNLISELENSFGFNYTEEVLHSLTTNLSMLFKRFNRGKFISIDPIEKEIIHPTKEYKAAEYIADKIETDCSIVFPEDEIYYIATFFLSAKRNNVYPDETEQDELNKLKQIVIHMIDDFQKFACVFFKNRKELEQNLFIHLKPAYYRIKYGITWSNPLAESVKETYSDLFVLTKKVMHHFEYFLQKPVSDDEIAYIAIHFGGWLNKEGMKVGHRKKAIIVCASGVGTSRILQKQIEDLLPSIDIIDVLTVRDYEEKELNQIDYIFSTVHLKQEAIPIHIVNPILKPSEKAALLKQIESYQGTKRHIDAEELIMIFKKHGQITNEEALYRDLLTYQAEMNKHQREVDQKPMLHDLLTAETIQLTNEKLSWQQALQMAAQPLLNGKYIDQSYVNAMIKGVENLGPYIVIAPGIALPHARPEDGVNKVGMSFLKLDNPCFFSDKEEHQVKLIFVLAAVDNEEHLKALSQLSTLLSDSTNIKQLNQAETVSDVLTIIQDHSN